MAHRIRDNQQGAPARSSAFASSRRAAKIAHLKTHDAGKTNRPTAQKTTPHVGAGPAARRIAPTDSAAQRSRVIQLLRAQALTERNDAATGKQRDTPDVSRAIAERRGQGAPLPEAVRSDLEETVAADLGDVRVHTDPIAESLNQRLQAKAFTTGSDIFFSRGSYDPHGSGGQKLLAHEATHVRQQREGPVSGTPTAAGVSVSEPGDRFEQEAESVANTFVQRQLATTADDDESGERPAGNLSPATQSGQRGNVSTLQREAGTSQARQGPPPIIPPADLAIADYFQAMYRIDNGMDLDSLADARGTQTEGSAGYAVVTSTTIYSAIGTGQEEFKETPLTPMGAMWPPGVYLSLAGQGLYQRLYNVDGREIFKYAVANSLKLTDWIDRDAYSDAFGVMKTTNRLYLVIAPMPTGSNPDEPTREGPARGKFSTWAPEWLQGQLQHVQDVIEEDELGQGGDLPDQVFVYPHKTRPDTFFMNVWVHADEASREKKHVAIKLNPAEDSDQLLARVREATRRIKAQQLAQQVQLLTEPPAWARALHLALEKELQRLRRRSPQATDLPDRTDLNVVSPAERPAVAAPERAETAEARAAEKPVARVFLDVKVILNRDTDRQRTVGGSLPFPLDKSMRAGDLIEPVRRAVALLRGDKPIEIGLTGEERNVQDSGGTAEGTATQRAIPAYILPVDLPSSGITVTGAQNHFRMELDYDALAENLVDDVTRRMRTVYFKWEVYDVSALTVAGEEEGRQLSWDSRAGALHRRVAADPAAYLTSANRVFSPDLAELAMAKFARPPQGGGVFPTAAMHAILHEFLVDPEYRNDDRLDDPRFILNNVPDVEIVKEGEVEFPRFPKDGGDYIVACTATPSAGDNFARASSQAYFPVRTQGIRDVARRNAFHRLDHIRALEAAKRELEALLADAPAPDREATAAAAGAAGSGGTQATDDPRQEALSVVNQELADLQARERQTLPQTAAAEIQRIKETKARLTRLTWQLPAAINKAEQALADEGAGADEEQRARPSDFLDDDLVELQAMLLREGKTIPGYRQELNQQQKQLEGIIGRVPEFSANFADMETTYQLEAAFVSRVTGQVYPLAMMLGKSSFQFEGWTGSVSFTLVDVTTSETSSEYSGTGATAAEAVDAAFRDFASECEYGEGVLAVRIPPGPQQKDDAPTLGTQIRYYTCEKDFWQGLVELLGKVALVASALALIATGVGSAGGAAILGAVAATAGAIVAVENLSDMARRHQLDWEHAPQIFMEVVSIIGAAPALRGAQLAGRAARASRTLPAWHLRETVSSKYLQIWGQFEEATTVILVPTQMALDIHRIENDPTLTDAQRKQKLQQAMDGVKTTGIMMLGGKVAGHVGQARQHRADSVAQIEQLQQQIRYLELEGGGSYKSMADRELWDAEPAATGDSGRRPTEGVGDSDATRITDQEQQAGTQGDDLLTGAHGGRRTTGDAGDGDAGGGDRRRDGAGSSGHDAGGGRRDGDGGGRGRDGDGGGRGRDGGGGGDGGEGDGGPRKRVTDQQLHDEIRKAGSMADLRARVDNGELAAGAVQQARQEIIDNAWAAEKPAIEAQFGVTLTQGNVGSPGLHSDIDLTAIAKSPQRKLLEEQGLSPAEIEKRLDMEALKSEIAATAAMADAMYRRLDQEGYDDPDKSLDANVYTNLPVTAITDRAPKAEQDAIRFHDNEVYSLAEMMRDMSSAERDLYRREQASRLKDSAEEFGDHVTGDFHNRFEQAEKLIDEVAATDIGALRQEMTRLMSDNPSPRIINEQMAKIKLKEPDAYGTDAAFHDVVTHQQTAGSSGRRARELELEGPYMGRDEIVALVEKELGKSPIKEQLSEKELAAFKQELIETRLAASMAAAARLGRGHAPGSAAYLTHMAQAGSGSTGKLFKITPDGASLKDVRSAAKQLLRVQHTGRMAELPADHMNRDVSRVLAAKYTSDADAATVQALRTWAHHSGRSHLVDDLPALRQAFVAAAQREALNIVTEVRTHATQERARESAE